MRLITLFSRILAILSGALILIAALLVTCSAFARYLFSASSAWTTELSVYLLMASVWLGTGPTMLANRHVAIRLLSRLGNKKLAVFTHVFSYVASIGVGSVLLVKGALTTMAAIKGDWHASTTWGPSLVGPYMIIPIGLFFFVIAALIKFVLPLTRYDGKS